MDQRAAVTRGAALGLGAACLFGASAPFAKLLLSATGPLMLAALLYLGAAAALSLYLAGASARRREAKLGRGDLPLVAAVVVLGGIVGPVLMLTGLARVSALAGSLLLNLEAPFTILLAVAFFGEALGPREALGAGAIVLGAVLVGVWPGQLRADWAGALALAGACLAWGIDNNLSQRLSLRSPAEVARAKTLGAGACTLLIALGAGYRPPGPAVALAALALGAVSYGLSLVLDVKALRLLGAAREAAYFATAPFLGALISVALFRKLPQAADWAGGLAMAGGVALLMRERHAHLHAHAELTHEHRHFHDEHHRHSHEGPVAEPHSHPHRHPPLTHDHPHLPDPHHRHRHP